MALIDSHALSLRGGFYLLYVIIALLFPIASHSFTSPCTTYGNQRMIRRSILSFHSLERRRPPGTLASIYDAHYHNVGYISTHSSLGLQRHMQQQQHQLNTRNHRFSAVSNAAAVSAAVTSSDPSSLLEDAAVDDHSFLVHDSTPKETSSKSSMKKKHNGYASSKPEAVADAIIYMDVNADEDRLYQGLKSRPVEGGNWNPSAPLDWAKDFGRRSPDYEQSLKRLVKLQPGDEGYFDVSGIEVPKATLVRTKEQARQVMKVLMEADPSVFHACDTEVMDIDLKQVGPVGNGYVTCVSIYSGPDFDYGLGDGPGTALWIDNLDDAYGVLQEFKAWFEDPTKFKVWHNYGFDRHVLWNEGIDCQGFGGDTMHMARLQNTSRSKADQGQGYSLEALTADLLGRRKRPMKEIFGIKRLRKDGTEGNIVDVPPVEVLQRDPKFRANFIMYSCYDAEGTWLLKGKLDEELRKMTWIVQGKSLYDYYWANMREFGKVLTDMERRGIRVDAKDYLAAVELQARKDRDEHTEMFRKWASSKIGADGLALNPASAAQLCTFLFGGAKNTKTKERTEIERVFKVAREEIPEDAIAAYRKRDEDATMTKTTKSKSEQCLKFLVLLSSNHVLPTFRG